MGEGRAPGGGWPEEFERSWRSPGVTEVLTPTLRLLKDMVSVEPNVLADMHCLDCGVGRFYARQTRRASSMALEIEYETYGRARTPRT